MGERAAMSFDAGGLRLFKDRAGSRVGVLRVGTRAAVEAQRLIEDEVDVLDPAVVQVVEHDRADADRFRDLVLVLKIGVLLIHDLAHLLDGEAEEVFEEHDVAGSRRQLRAVHGNRSVGDVDDVLRPLIAHQLEHLLELREVQALLCGRDVDRLVEVIRLLAVDRRSDIARVIDGGAVAFNEDAGRHVPLGQVDDLRAVVQFEKAERTDLLDRLFHEAALHIEGLARVGVEVDAELTVGLRVLREGDVAEPFPEREVLGIALLELVEFSPRQVLERRILFRLFMELHVEPHELVDADPLDGLTVAPAAEGHDLLSELRAPVAEVVDPRAVVADEFVQELDRMSDDRRAEMPDVEGLADVRR